MKTKLVILPRALKTVFSASSKYNIWMAISLFIIGTMPAINIYTTGQLVALFENKNSNHSIVLVIIIWGISMLLPALLRPLTDYLQSHINQLVTNKVVTQIMQKNASFNGLSAYDNEDMQNSIAILKSESKYRPTNFSVNLVILTQEIVTIASLAIILITIKWWIPLAIILGSIPLAYINYQVASFSWQALISSSRDNRLMDYFSSLSFIREAQKDIHLFNAYDLITAKYNISFQTVYAKLKDAQAKIFIKPIPFQVLSVIVVSLVLFSLYQQSQMATITVASVVVLLQSIFILNSHVGRLIQHTSLLYEVLDYFKQFFTFLDYEDDIKDGDLTLDRIQTIEFINVGFHYPNSDKPVLNSISFYAECGESLAIVGHNGAGKSTLAHLICRFWDVSEGQILINNKDICTYNVASLRACIGAVFQDFFKFNMSISENITFNQHPILNPAPIKQALRLPDELSMDTLVGKSYGGIELSGGQWQRVAILRCLHTDSSMIILDEPTSAIDPKAEAKLYDEFKTLSHHKLSFMITHRLGSVNGVDRVLVIDKGRLVQDDSPEHLKKVDGPFKELWSIQAGMYV